MTGGGEISRGVTGRVLGGAALCLAALAAWAPGSAPAHFERPAYWPDPAPDTSIQPPAGGQVPKARSLGSALREGARGKTRVVCKPNSMALLRAAIAHARRHGYDIRPTDHRRLSARRANKLLRLNRALAERCAFREIQPAITASGNNDRVVVMPGVYTEPTSRKQPTFDPKCDKYESPGDHPGEAGAPSYVYQFHCPNDANLIAVMGRKPGKSPPPNPPLYDRHGIPDLGPCIRCNLQLEGSGVSADDVVIDAGRVKAGNGGPSGAGSKKDVGIHIDRADGFVLRNLTVRHAAEHNIYILESDGYRLEDFKTFYPGLYGVLTFVEDHGLIQDCEAVGGGDSGLYPGAPAETGYQRAAGTEFRYNQEIRDCDAHHNMAGYSATDGNAVHVDHNNFYDNTLGLTTDVVTAAGHPGFPGDSTLFEKNRIYSNNFDPYGANSDVKPAFPYPIGTGLWIAGGNHHTVRDNYIYDNWRRGTMQFAVPDVLVCGPDTANTQAGCDPAQVSTSHYDSYYGNRMGVSPSGKAMPNGLDFWWDSFAGNVGNCWYQNTGPAPITSDPAALPSCEDGRDPDSSMGTGNPAATGELLACFVAFESGNYDPATCPWFVKPAKPGTRAPRHQTAAERRRMRATYVDFCATVGAASPTCGGAARAKSAARTRPARRHPASGTSLRLEEAPTCSGWQRADRRTRWATVAALREFVGGQVNANGAPGAVGTVLDDRQAYRLFQNDCRSSAARHFVLYKLYGHAAAFIGVPPR